LLVHYGHYLHLVSVTGSQLKTTITQDQSIPEERRQAILAQLDKDPAPIVDSILADETHHSGFIGSLFLRNQQGVTLKGNVVTGTLLWILWAGEALLVAVIASAMASARAGEPFCEDCGYWCEKQANVFALPAGVAAPLVQAVQENDHAHIAHLRTSTVADGGPGTVGASLYACPNCDQSFADVSHRFVKGKETKVKVLLKQHRVSPEVVEVIRGRPAQEQPATGATPGENESIMSREEEDHPE
jgi:hypothetical protein